MLKLPLEIEKYRKDIEKTKNNFIKITTDVMDRTLLSLESKIGGIPYMPIGYDYPIIDGVKGKMFAQINLNDIKFLKSDLLEEILLAMPKDKGVLQFWYASDSDYCGLEFNGNKNRVEVVYIPCSSLDEKGLLADEMEIAYATNFVVDSELKLNFTQGLDYLSLSDEYNVVKLYNGINFTDSEVDSFYESDLDNYGSKIGGYATFSQSDPREYDGDIENQMVLLFQVDSDDNLMWGDSGVGNWFVPLSDLKKLDFSRVMFNWDCC